MNYKDFHCRACQAHGRSFSTAVECPSCGSVLVHFVTGGDIEDAHRDNGTEILKQAFGDELDG